MATDTLAQNEHATGEQQIDKERQEGTYKWPGEPGDNHKNRRFHRIESSEST